MNRKKEISWGTILSFGSQAISIIVGLLYTPIMTGILGQDEYGLYQLVQSVVNYLNLMNFGFNGAYIRYYSIARSHDDEKEVNNVNGMFMKVFLIIAGLCIIIGAVLLLKIDMLGQKISEENYGLARKLLLIMVINVAISFPNSLFIAYMSANEKFVFQKGLNTIVNIVTPLLSIPLLYLGMGSLGVVSVTLFITIARFIVNWIYCVVKLKMGVSWRYFNKTIFGGLLGYTFFIFLSDLVDQLNSNVDKFLLGREIGTIAVAIYSIGYNLKTYYVTVSWIVPEMYIPEVNRLAVEGNNDRALTERFTQIGRINNYLMLLVLTGFVLIGRLFINLWVGSEYDTSYFVCIILMMAAYIPGIQTLGVNIQNAKNMHRTRSIVYLAVACVNVVCSIFLIRIWGIIGTCIGTLIATLLGHGVFMNIYYHKKIGLNIGYFWKEILKWYPPVIGLFAASLVFTHFVRIETWFGMIGFAIVYVIIYLGLLYLIGLKREEKERVLLKIKGVVHKG